MKALQPIISGTRFDRLSVLQELPPRFRADGRISRRVLCRCDCGTEKAIDLYSLRQGKIHSCGCWKTARMRKLRTKHGHCKDFKRSKIYNIWLNMIARCTNQKGSGYEYYGARGIKVCERWRAFENFYADMGDVPAGLTLDRLNNNGNYEPENCAWRTIAQQLSNRRPYKPRRIRA